MAAGVLTTRGVLTRRLARSVQRAWAQRRGVRGWERVVVVGRLGGVVGCGGVVRGMGLVRVVAFMWAACVAWRVEVWIFCREWKRLVRSTCRRRRRWARNVLRLFESSRVVWARQASMRGVHAVAL